ncbi:MAG: carboxymuconolactone decarboxylase family protein [bacterium]|nr:carboxymuconolactone decarboxylase family protein [bacterium]
MMSKEQRKTYREFYNSARQNPTLDPKVTLMIHLAASMAVGCYP